MAHLSKGTKITIFSDSPVVDIPEVSEITGPERSKDEIETTHLQSTDKEFLTGFSDNSLNFATNYQPGNTVAVRLRAIFTGDELVTWRVSWTQLSPVITATFSGRIISMSEAATVGDKLNQNVGIKISGAITYA